MATLQVEIQPAMRRTGQRAGYGVAILVNLVILVIVQNVLDWGWPAFLTPEFADVVPWITFSLVASVLANTIYLVNRHPDVKSVGQIGLNLIGLFVTYGVWLVFPFDFSSYGFDWTRVTNAVLILAMVGSGAGVLAESVKAAKRHIDTKGDSR
ncbi:MAG: hypothetical protein WBM90_04935 [Acidimicrobiia bacterium]